MALENIMKVIGLIGWTVSVAATPTKRVELFNDTVNQHAIEKTPKKTSDEVKWLSNINDKLLPEKEDKDNLRMAMVAHFN